MNTQKTNSPIPPSAQLVLDFFDNELAEARFPDVDQTILQGAADHVMSLAEAVARAEAALEVARQALQEGQDQLLGKCGRALAYARIYAEDDPDLSRRLEAINLPRQARDRQPALGDSPEGREGRPERRRTRKAPGTLFVEPPQDNLPI